MPEAKTATNPPVEAFANGGRVYLAECRECEVVVRLDSPAEVDELIVALELAKRQAWPELKTKAMFDVYGESRTFVGKIGLGNVTS